MPGFIELIAKHCQNPKQILVKLLKYQILVSLPEPEANLSKIGKGGVELGQQVVQFLINFLVVGTCREKPIWVNGTTSHFSMPNLKKLGL